MDFKDISVVNVLFVSDLFGNGDPALYTHSDGILRHVCCLSMCLYGFCARTFVPGAASSGARCIVHATNEQTFL